MRWILLACLLLFEAAAFFGSRAALADRYVNGIQQPDDPNELADRPVRAAAKAAREAAYVPPLITRYQLLAALRQMNRTVSFTTYVNGLSAANQEWWQTKKSFRRNAPQVVALKLASPAGMGLTDAQIDAVWKLGVSFDD